MTAKFYYQVLDEADIMLDSNFTKLHKVFSLFKSRAAEDPSFQTILVASTNEKVGPLDICDFYVHKLGPIRLLFGFQFSCMETTFSRF